MRRLWKTMPGSPGPAKALPGPDVLGGSWAGSGVAGWLRAKVALGSPFCSAAFCVNVPSLHCIPSFDKYK